MSGPIVSWGLASDGPDRPMRSDSKRNRDLVVDALLALHSEGNLRPSSNEIAERAGISPRSLFRYFADIDDLSRAAISRQLERVRPMLAIDAPIDADLATRVAALARSRASVFEVMGPSGQVARLRAPFKSVIAAELAHARLFFRQQIEQLLAAELSRMDDDRRIAIVAAIDVLCSFESWHLLRGDHGLDEDAAIATLTTAVEQMLATAGD